MGCERNPPSREWLVMLYMGAADAVIDARLVDDLNETEQVGSSEHVAIVAQLDRFDGGTPTDATSAKRYLVTQDDDLYNINSEIVEDLGEVDMTDPSVLESFVSWAIETYPAERRILVFGGHGAGWRGILDDVVSGTKTMMGLPELGEALDATLKRNRVDSLSIIGFSACLMGQVEVLDSLESHCDFVVASECTECALGWGYGGFLRELQDDPSMSPSDLAVCVIENEIVGDAFVTSETARVIAFLRSWLTSKEFTPELIQSVGRMSHAEIVELLESYGASESMIPTAEKQANHPDALADFATIAAFDLTALPDVLDGVLMMSESLSRMNPEDVEGIRAACRGDAPGCWDMFQYVDLACLAATIAEQESTQSGLVDALERLIVKARQGVVVQSLGGLSIWFPARSDLDNTTWTTYRETNARFAEQTGWDAFLKTHTGSAQSDTSEGQPVK